MAVTINGVACRWGLPSDLAITESVVGTMQLQGFEIGNNAEMDRVRDHDGDTVTTGYFDPSQDCQFEYVVKGATITAAKAAAKIPSVGAIVTITVTAGEIGETLNSTKWEVQASPKLVFSNTGFARVTLPLRRHPEITAVASAS